MLVSVTSCVTHWRSPNYLRIVRHWLLCTLDSDVSPRCCYRKFDKTTTRCYTYVKHNVKSCARTSIVYIVSKTYGHETVFEYIMWAKGVVTNVGDLTKVLRDYPTQDVSLKVWKSFLGNVTESSTSTHSDTNTLLHPSQILRFDTTEVKSPSNWCYPDVSRLNVKFEGLSKLTYCFFPTCFGSENGHRFWRITQLFKCINSLLPKIDTLLLLRWLPKIRPFLGVI